jgi:thioredoxin reductase/ferredoxin
MSSSVYFLLIYLSLFLLILVLYLYRQQQREKKNLALQKKQVVASCPIPVSLHPVIDPAKCMGCGSCVAACPEQHVLGIINRQSTLITASKCIGHGACKRACPFDSISLVFGTEKRGVEIPYVRPNFETNIPGVFIAGELGGMGLICNAIEQGRQAMEAISATVRKQGKMADIHDVVIVGSGPAGFSASLLALEKRLKYITFEQETLGGTVAHYPRGKIVMTHPVVLPMVGKTSFKQTTKEQLLKFWQEVEAKSGVKIHYLESVVKVAQEHAYITVTTQKNTYKTQAVLLAIGRRGTPRKLGVPGEEKSKVVYRLIDPAQYASQHVLIVGGGDSALEAAVSLAAIPGTTVTLSYRREAFSGVKEENSVKVQAAQGAGRLGLLFNSNVIEIKDQEVVLDQAGKKIELKNDAVIICAGGMLPITFLKEIGIQVEAKYGTA